ncbi:MAG: hypothetical protein HQK57_06825 [Deltaproteobacteria bacterium]|nr:hypothetical protein [Deltaproteobacteria bacterium]
MKKILVTTTMVLAVLIWAMVSFAQTYTEGDEGGEKKKGKNKGIIKFEEKVVQGDEKKQGDYTIEFECGRPEGEQEVRTGRKCRVSKKGSEYFINTDTSNPYESEFMACWVCCENY